MSEEVPDTEPLERLLDAPGADPSLAAMLRAAERDLPPVDADRIIGGLPGGGGGGAAAAGATPAQWALLVAGSLAAGAFLSLSLGGASSAARGTATGEVEAAPAPVERPSPEPALTSSVAPAQPAPRPGTPAPSRRSRAPLRAPSTPDASEAAVDPLGEGTLLLRARRELARGDASAALGAVGIHEARYPAGRLSLEREAIAVDALAQAGRRDAARSRARALLARWPDSPYTQAAREVLGEASLSDGRR